MISNKLSTDRILQFNKINSLFARIFQQFWRSKFFRHKEFWWLLTMIFAGSFLLLGRYDWALTVRHFSLRGYLSSAYFFIITTCTVFFLLKTFFLQYKKWIWGLTLLFVVCFSLPYRWLRLDQFYYNKERPVSYNTTDFALHWSRPWTPDLVVAKPSSSPFPITNWLPEAWSRLDDMPHEALFFLILFVVGLLVLITCLKVIENRGIHIWFWFGLFLLILFQTYLHLSLRSPILYITHFTRPPEQNQLYVKFMFPNYEGAVNADMPVYRSLEEHFFGTPRVTSTLLIRRAYSFYISSQLSYFIGMYYSFLFLNIMLWFISCICIYLLGRTWWKQEVGVYMAFFVGCGPGFIMFVAQPMSYLPGYAVVVILIYLFERLLVGSNIRPALGNYLLFGCLLGLGSSVYDIFTWYIFFLLYGLVRRRSLTGLILSIGVGLTVYLGFIWIQTDVLRLDLNIDNSKYLGESIQNIYLMIAQRRLDTIYSLTLNFFGTYFNQLAHVFFVIPLILALSGIFLLRSQPQIRILSLLLFLPSVIGFAFLYYGETKFGDYLMSSFPRFNYPAYPAVYLLAAGMLAEGRAYLSQKGWLWLGYLTAWGTLIFVFVLSNIDAFGFLPQLYYLIYFTSGGYFK